MVVLAALAAGCNDDAGGPDAPKRAPRAAMTLGFIHRLDDIEPGANDSEASASGAGNSGASASDASDSDRGQPAAAVTVDTDDGAQINVEQAFVVISAIEAHLCEPDAPDRAEHGWLLPGGIDRLGRLLLPRAYAHVPSSAIRLGTPFVENLFARSQARIVGEIAPPVGRYCKLYAVMSPADPDVVSLGRLDIDEMVGNTLMIRGRWRPTPTAKWRPFSSASTSRKVVELDAVDPQTGHHPLRLEQPGATKMLLVDKRVSPRLFAGITPDQLDGPDAADLVLKRLQRTLAIHQFND